MPQENSATGFINKTMTARGHERAYVVYVPRGYTPDKAWPLIMFLHGAGERGDDGLLQSEVGIGRAIRRHEEWFPCIVIMPQCPKEVWWDKTFEDIDTALADTLKAYTIDPKRVYLTGLSMGGYGTWMLGPDRLDTYAALIPICGGGKTEDAAKLAKVPIWAFHGADDSTVPVKASREMIEAIKKAGGTIKYTEFPGVQHNSWDHAYDDPDTIKWLLKQHK